MSAEYRARGYLLSTVVVPVQRIADGRVRLEAVEGFVSTVRVEGDAVRSGLIDAQRRQLLAHKPARTADLERFLLLLNDLPGITAQGVLRPAPDVRGGSELFVKLQRVALEVGTGANNRGSRLQGPSEIEGFVSLNGVLRANEGTDFRYLAAHPTRELELYALDHVERLTGGGLDLRLSASHSIGEPDIGGVLNGFNLETQTTQGRLELAYPVLRTRTNNVHVRAALTYHDGKTDIVGFPLYKDKISAARVGFSWDGVDALAGVNLLDIEISKGIGAFGASGPDDPFASRPGGDPRFSKATLYAARLQDLSHGFSALFAVNVQDAFTNLLSPEEFAFGGEQFGRAYDPSELVGDSGYAGKVELRYTHDFASRLELTFYTFGETGKIRRRLAPIEASAKREERATDAGGGVRFTFMSFVTGYVEAADSLNHVIAAEGRERTRVFGGLMFQWQF
jgi:hemolysin activation/secretion protein